MTAAVLYGHLDTGLPAGVFPAGKSPPADAVRK